MLGRADLLSVVFYSIIKLHKCAYNEIMLKMKMRNAIMQSKLTETDAETEKEDCMMKKYEIGLYEKAMRNTLSWSEKLKCAKECGYDYMEMCIDAKDEKINRIFMNSII